jgi:hypothetical protein
MRYLIKLICYAREWKMLVPKFDDDILISLQIEIFWSNKIVIMYSLNQIFGGFFRFGIFVSRTLAEIPYYIFCSWTKLKMTIEQNLEKKKKRTHRFLSKKNTFSLHWVIINAPILVLTLTDTICSRSRLGKFEMKCPKSSTLIGGTKIRMS